MGPKPESLWWTSTYKEDDVSTLKVGTREKILGLALHGKYLMSWAVVFDEMGKGVQGRVKTLRRAQGSWWRDG